MKEKGSESQVLRWRINRMSEIKENVFSGIRIMLSPFITGQKTAMCLEGLHYHDRMTSVEVRRCVKMAETFDQETISNCLFYKLQEQHSFSNSQENRFSVFGALKELNI